MKHPSILRGIAPVLLLLLILPAPPARGAGTPPALRRTATGERLVVPPPARPLNVYQKGAVERYLSGTAVGAVGVDTLRVIVFQVQFTDSLMGGQPGSHRTELRDTQWFSNEMGHLTDYFQGASRGRLELAWTIDPKLYTLPKAMGYYGRDTFEEERVVELVATMIDSTDATVDFTRYDHVFIIHAGAGQETDLAGDSRLQIWSSFYDANDIDAATPGTPLAGIPTDDLVDGEPFLVDNFSIVPANASQDFTFIGTLGVWAFEVANRLGLIPLFDSTPAGVPDGQGVGSFCLMSFGLFNVNGFIPSFPCAFNRMIVGWLEPVTIEPSATPRTLRLTDVNTGADNDTLCVRIPITENEYYLVTNRVHDSNFDSLFTFVDLDSNLVPSNTDSLTNAEFDFFMTDVTNPAARRFLPAYGFEVLLRHTGSGVYVWHIDENVIRETLNSGFLPNDFNERKGVDLEEADGVQDMDAGGSPAFTLGSFFDSYRAGDGNQNAFTPTSEPASLSNSGVRTGIAIEDISTPGHVMTCVLRLDAAHVDHRVRWQADTFAQPATVANLDGLPGGGNEIVVFADSGRAYVFDSSGAEYDDADADPATIEPLFQVSGDWVGAPVVGNLDGGADLEIVGVTTDGDVYLWKSTGGVSLLHSGLAMAAPPMLVDLLADGTPEIALVESDGDSLRVRFIDADGNPFEPGDPAFSPLWPLAVQGHYAAALGWAGTGNGTTPGKEGVVLVSVDTLTSSARLTYVPAAYPAGMTFVGQPVARTWTATIGIPAGVKPADFRISAPAVGDIDADGHDEIVVATSDGRLFIYENDAGETGRVEPEEIELRAALPSAPVLGDTDLDGTLEIALRDEEFMYLLESNGRLVTGWPIKIIGRTIGELPPRTIERGLESPVIADLDGDGTIEVLFATQDGSLRAFGHDGEEVAGFPRVGPAGATTTPTVDATDFGGGLSLVITGSIPSIVRVDTVVDSFRVVNETTLSIQTLPGSSVTDRRFWSAHRNGGARHGRVSESAPLKTASAAVQPGSFMVYPNPVVGAMVHARVTLNGSATVRLEIYNLEGEEVVARSFSANGNELIGTPFDEAIDVSDIVSGIYFLRLEIDGALGSETMVKPFAIRR